MLDLISYLLFEVPELLVTEYFIPCLAVTLLVGVLELVFMLLGIRRKRWDI